MKSAFVFSGVESENTLELDALKANFDFSIRQDETAEDLVKQKKHDLIVLSDKDYHKFESLLSAVDWQVNQLKIADSLVLQEGFYRPVHAEAEAIIRLIRLNPHRINSQKSVIVIGELGFVSAVAMKLAMSGFSDIMVALVDSQPEDIEALKKKFARLVFGLDLKVILATGLVSVDYSASLMISKFDKEKNKDTYELMTYFNFLSSSALLIDCYSYLNSYLIEEARRAEVDVIEEGEVITTKYAYLAEIMKNSP